MEQNKLSQILLNQNRDLIWVINTDYQLIYANSAYQSRMKEATGAERNLNQSIFTESFGKEKVEKWKAYYDRALKGEKFEIEEECFNQTTQEFVYNQVSFKPLREYNQQIFAVACQTTDITQLVKQKAEAARLLDASLDVFCSIDAASKFVYVSAAAVNHWGYSSEELIGTSYTDLIVEADLAKTKIVAEAIMNGHTFKAFSNRFLRKDGEIAYNLWSASWDDESKIMHCVARDAKERIEHEEKIQLSEQRFKALVQEGSDLIAIMDMEGNYSYVSPTSTSILGIIPEEFIGRNAFDFIHPEDKERVLSGLQNLTEKKKIVIAPFRFQNHKKEWRWIDSVLTNMLDNPAVKGIVANSRDITEEKKLKELNRQVGKMAKIGGWELDLRNMITSFSEETYRIHGLPIGSTPKAEDGMKFYAPEAQSIIQEVVSKAIKDHTPYNVELPFINAKGKNIWVRTQGEVEVNNGQAIRLYGTIQDITDRKEAEDRLQSLANNLPGIFFQYQLYPDGTESFHHISGAVEQLWGFTAQQISENSNLIWDQIRAGGNYEEVRKSILKAVETKSKWTSRIKYVTPAGKLQTNLGFGTPVFLADGSILFNSIVLDITKEVENEQLLEQVTKIARIGSWELDLENQQGDNMYWSPMLFDIVEVDQDYNPTLSGGIEFHIGESKARIKKALELLIKEGVEFDEEILLLTAKGNKRWSRAIGKSEMVNKKRTRIYGSYQDIHKRKIAELENKFKANLLSTIGQAAIATNLEGVVNYWNKAAEIIYGWKEEEAIGKNIMTLTTPETSIKQAEEIMEKLKQGKSWSGVFNMHKKDGTIFPARITNSPIYDEHNKLSGIIGISSDITQKAKNEELLRQYTLELEHSNEKLRKIAWTQSHVVRAPISRILGIINLLEEYPDNYDKISLWLKELKNSTIEMDQIVKTIIAETNSLKKE